MHKLWNDESQCGNTKKEERANHNGNHKGNITKSKKQQKTFSYACHICGLNGHKMIDCLKFAEMLKMFHGKFVAMTEVQHVAET